MDNPGNRPEDDGQRLPDKEDLKSTKSLVRAIFIDPSRGSWTVYGTSPKQTTSCFYDPIYTVNNPGFLRELPSVQAAGPEGYLSAYETKDGMVNVTQALAEIFGIDESASDVGQLILAHMASESKFWVLPQVEDLLQRHTGGKGDRIQLDGCNNSFPVIDPLGRLAFLSARYMFEKWEITFHKICLEKPPRLMNTNRLFLPIPAESRIRKV